VAAAYRTINEADPDTQAQVERLRRLYREVGEDPEVGERAISEILENGPDAATRLAGTADAVARLHGLKED
jgi:hypothetical protein